MRKPDTIERLYLDFDGFFASVEQQARPELRGRPVGIVPFTGTDRTCVIAASREAKAFGVKNVMNVAEARAHCPDLMLVPQSPDLYRRAHNTLLAEIAAVIPIDAVKSIDELTCRMDAAQARAPQDLARRIKSRIHEHVGRFITCSIGFAANRQLAKMASKMDKPDGVTVWAPEAMPSPLMALKLSDIPGVGGRMEARLSQAGIRDVPTLYATQPKQMRKLWGNVTGERLWYALHGYDVQAGATSRGMFGHGRVLPQAWMHGRSASGAHPCRRHRGVRRRLGVECAVVILVFSASSASDKRTRCGASDDAPHFHRAWPIYCASAGACRKRDRHRRRAGRPDLGSISVCTYTVTMAIKLRAAADS